MMIRTSLFKIIVVSIFFSILNSNLAMAASTSGTFSNVTSVNFFSGVIGTTPPDCFTPLQPIPGSDPEDNQIRYGTIFPNQFCGGDPNLMSGLGFEGTNSLSLSCAEPLALTNLGTFTHYNNPISITNGNILEGTDLTIEIDVDDNGSTDITIPSAAFDFDETSNNGNCPYGAPPSDPTQCFDRVFLENFSGTFSITDSTTGETCDLVVSGFGDCNSGPSDVPTQEFITVEGSQNDACLFAQLAITTPVTLSSISNEVTGKKVNVDWTTSSELFNVGYQLWGLDGHDSKWEKLHAWLVRSGSGNAVEPQSYSRTASIPGSVKDLVAIGLSSVDSDGSEHYYGPFDLNQSYGDLTQLKPIGWNHIRAEVDASMTSKGYVKDRVNGYRRLTAASAADSETVMDITVDQSGLYRITSSELAAAGMDLSAIKNRQIAIVDHTGAPVVRYVWARGSGSGLNKTLGAGGEVYFYGQSPDEHAGLYSEMSQYRLVVDKTKALIAPLQGKQGINSGFSETYREQLRVEVDTQYTLAAQANDPWVERVMVSYANHTSVASKQLDLPGGVDQSQGVELLIGVGRGSGLKAVDANQDGIQDPEHIITGAVADETGAAVWQTPISEVGTGVWQARIPVNTVLGDVDALTPGLQVNVGASFSAGPGYSFSEIQLDTMGLEYARRYTPKADQLHLSFAGPNEGESGYAVQMTDRGYAMVFAYNEAGSLVRLVPESQVREKVNGENVRLVKFAPLVGAGTQGDDVKYWLSSKPGYLKPGLSVDTIASKASLVAQAQGADFLMIAHPVFMGTALEGYALHKQGQGYRTAIVDYSEIVRVYGGGQTGPEGLTQYLRAVEAAGDLTAVLLIGSSVYDHLDRLGTGSMTFIPGHYGESAYSKFTVSDVPYVTDTQGGLFASMGRWPVRELSELSTIIAKSVDWSTTDHTNAEALLIAEHTVAGENIDFGNALDNHLQPQIPAGWTNTKVYVDKIMENDPSLTLNQALARAKTRIVNQLNSNPDVVLYNGHGTTSQLSNKGLFKSSDVDSITSNGAEMWIPMSCYVTYYESTHVNTLAHQLMFSGNAVNISGAMLLSEQAENISMGKSLVQATMIRGEKIGEAINSYKQKYDDDKLSTNWALLGDPTLSGDKVVISHINTGVSSPGNSF